MNTEADFKDLKEFLEKKDISYTPELQKVIEELTIFCAENRDEWLCSLCLTYGGRDCPDLIICSKGCYRSYCLSCITHLQWKCGCGDEIDKEDYEDYFEESSEKSNSEELN
jgi:hypothetical protein